MKEKELLEFLKEYLKVELTFDVDGDLAVNLKLNDKIISTDWVSLHEV